MGKIHISIDGPAGAGKSTIAKLIADKLQITYIDTGAMYRALTYKLLSQSTELKNIPLIIKISNETLIELEKDKIFLDHQDVSSEIRKPIVSQNVSKVACVPEVRKRMVEIQRQIAQDKSVIMDGRDIGTFVLPNAKYKFFLTASIEERAYRRHIELQNKGIITNYEDIKEEITKRDKMDTERIVSPLKPAKDAIMINTTSRPIQVVVNDIIDIINRGKRS